MAPTSPIKRVTRARAAAKTSTAEPASKKVGTTKVAKPTTSKPATTVTRKTRAVEDDIEEDELAQQSQPLRKTTRTTKTTPLTTTTRRRIKVTPLSAPIPEEPALMTESEKPTKKPSSRTKKTDPTTAVLEEVQPAPTKTRTRSTKTATTSAKVPSDHDRSSATSKTRGRPKKETIAEKKAAEAPEPPRAMRQTRARSASAASQPPVDTVEVIPKPKTASRKKVTFQDVPEDDKENEIVPARRAATRKAAPTTGMRAKPLRKSTAAATKKTSTTKSIERVLTPKKVTQVARAVTPESSEDELSGAKSPIRDLSLSPKRNPNVAALLSPAKKLNFSQASLLRSPQKSNNGAVMQSPARRLLSPAKTSGADDTVTVALAVQSGAGFLQSPKRGIADTSIFPASAIKAKRSPLKQSLLQSPARRLFSPAKSKTPLSVHRDGENSLDGLTDIAVSSHFRSSMSPQRAPVYRMTEEELADELAMTNELDQSVLKLTSPRKSPMKAVQPLATVFDEEQPMQVIQNNAQETAKAVEELQAEEASVIAEDGAAEIEEIIEPAQMSISATDESAEENEVEERPETLAKAPRLSQVLFRASRFQDEDESSEDELAADSTPDRAPRLFRSSLTGATNPPSRLSRAVDQNLGFTPLATQMSGWLANSPHKTPAKSAKKQAAKDSLFSPLASQHVAGEVQISRDNTPQQHRASPAFKSSVNSRPSMSGLGVDTPERSTFFAEQMSSMNHMSSEEPVADDMDIFEDEQEDLTTRSEVAAENEVIRSELQNVEDTVMAGADEEDSTVIINKAPEELTTDLVNTVHASDTAMLDFQELAHEAEDLADPEEDVVNSSFESVYGDENAPPDQTLNFSVMERSPTPEQQTLNFHVMERSAVDDVDQTLNLHVLEQNDESHGSIDVANPRPVAAVEDLTLNLHFLEEYATSQSPRVSQSQHAAGTVDQPTLHFDILEQASPIRSTVPTPRTQRAATEDTALNFNVLEERALQAASSLHQADGELDQSQVGSPESTASPYKLVVDQTDIVTPRPAIVGPRIVNTVVSKVPLKPAGDISPIKVAKKRSRSMSMSHQQSPPKRPQLTPLGKLAARSTSDPVLSPSRFTQIIAPTPARSTPGQMSFAIDDFGDSTLDGIEMPEDVMDIDFSIHPTDTPASTRSVKPTKSAAGTPARTPLRAVSPGILDGAVVYVEVRTSEGADSSHVYVELLTSLGARCVRDWRWNSRASVQGGDDFSAAGKPGITHVVYKDGGKRTLEKVRDAKGQVLCVGCAWVLDCERNKEWVDESPYLVNSDILPRGGSRRRKSMEPRALVNANGNLSTARSNTGRRSVSAEFMTSQMRDELVNTPARSYQPPVTAHDARRESLGADSLFGDSDISSTYNSPTTTMNVHHVATPTALVGWDPASSKTPAKSNDAQELGMDTPYLMKQGGMVMEHMMGRDGGVMSAPPKQIGKGLFDNGNDDGEYGGGPAEGQGKKDQAAKLKLKLQEARRRTLGFKPVIGSPLGKF